MGKSWTKYKKLHKWPGLILSLILIYYAVTGIIMNHRDWIAGIDFNRGIMPDNYAYRNWNNAALKGNIIINKDSILVYGNIGIWLTDSAFTRYQSFNSGFRKGSDNRKIFDVLKTSDNNLYAATLTGLWSWNKSTKSWQRLPIEDREQRFTALESSGDTVFALNRSCLYRGISDGTATKFEKIQLPAPAGYDNKITLFQTIWQIHSGEIFGLPGKIYVDILAVIVIFLSVTGIIWFFAPGIIKKRVREGKENTNAVITGKWSLKWHNKVGAWTFILLIVLFLSGMFLRPPLLIAIGYSRVLPIKYSHLDQPNPWYDKLRDILYDSDNKMFMLATNEGIFHFTEKDPVPVAFDIQPPVSVMGINVFEKYGKGTFLVGSFSGLFLWNPANPVIYDFISGNEHHEARGGRPVGEHTVTGMITDCSGNKYFADYSAGAESIRNDKQLPAMPDNILMESKISLWNLCLEVHTGRIFEKVTGDFYILIVPLVGIASLIVVISGYVLWRRKYR